MNARTGTAIAVGDPPRGGGEVLATDHAVAVLPSAKCWVPAWLVLVVMIAAFANVLASISTYVTTDLMRGVSDFALRVREHDKMYLHYYRSFAFLVVPVVVVTYLWPIIAYFRG